MFFYTFIKDNRDAILNVAASHGVKKMRMFGSVVRGEEKPESDIDFLVELDDDRSLFDLIALKQDLEGILSTKVDVVTEDSIHWYIKDKIIEEAIEI